MPPWFRFYSETLTDRKIERISRSLEQPKALVIGAWAILMAIGNDSPVRGVLLLTEDIAFTENDLADELGLNLDTTCAILDQFERFRMLHRDDSVIYLTNWGKRQFASDDSSERVKRYRNRKTAKHEQDGNDIETLQGRDGNAPEQNRDRTETETETETDKEAETETETERDPPVTTAAGSNNRDIPAITECLASLGVMNPKRDALAASPWITTDYIDAWWAYIKSWEADPVIMVPSLIARLESRRMPPGPEPSGKETTE